jgi:hypothetical protein
MCLIDGDIAATAFIIGPTKVRTSPIPELNADGLWVISAEGIALVSAVKIQGQLFFESSSVTSIEPGRFVFDTETNQLLIRPYD